MSIQSKARRDARKKKQGKRGHRSVAQAIEPHATLRDGDGPVLAGAGRRGREWVVVLGGKVVAGTQSAAMTMAMLRHMASLRENEGLSVQLAYSTALRSAAMVEAQQQGKTLETLLADLEAERLERHAKDDEPLPNEAMSATDTSRSTPRRPTDEA